MGLSRHGPRLAGGAENVSVRRRAERPDLECSFVAPTWDRKMG
jgi:hypothetical protein